MGYRRRSPWKGKRRRGGEEGDCLVAAAAAEGDEEGDADDEDEGEKVLGCYSSTQSILLVGDGDFSFLLALAAAFRSGTNIVATSLDTYGSSTWIDCFWLLETRKDKIRSDKKDYICMPMRDREVQRKAMMPGAAGLTYARAFLEGQRHRESVQRQEWPRGCEVQRKATMPGAAGLSISSAFLEQCRRDSVQKPER
nr:unnamed protein product [Digitaria exilis]